MFRTAVRPLALVRQVSRKYLSLFVAILAFSATAWQAYVAWDSEHRSLRAYVSLVPGSISGNLADIATQTVVFTRKNHGQTPAYDFRIPKSGIGVEPCDQPVQTPSFQVPELPIGNPTLFPGSKLLTHFTPNPSEAERVKINIALSNALSNEAVCLIYFGKAVYRDAFGDGHFTNFCWKYHGRKLEDVFRCEENNDSN
jgi:hypothetical protein